MPFLFKGTIGDSSYDNEIRSSFRMSRGKELSAITSPSSAGLQTISENSSLPAALTLFKSQILSSTSIGNGHLRLISLCFISPVIPFAWLMFRLLDRSSLTFTCPHLKRCAPFEFWTWVIVYASYAAKSLKVILVWFLFYSLFITLCLLISADYVISLVLLLF